MSLNLQSIRQDYAKQTLSIKECAISPFNQFELWLKQAIDAKVNEPTAMNVATVDQNGMPTARIVLLKEMSQEGFIFYTNYESRKGLAIAQNPHAALTFFWPELERQVRIEGSVQKVDTQVSDVYFASRPYTSRLGAWASHQSQEITGHAQLIKEVAKLGIKYPLKVPRPDYWGGYIVIPDRVEFWQGRPSRLHDRILYEKNNDSPNLWTKVRLSP
ncbi:pyridoxamine 5'-phosphate oxidase [Neisseria sp. Ec49-e6-T10]|uniref:pyridoxamine 5'-phosphate oxidase n=1 Tax=Neisseria sp. Ec49-e6-T10 TaxID=3140744 RepID=UPI003EB97B22